jgi:hypothetical protein
MPPNEKKSPPSAGKTRLGTLYLEVSILFRTAWRAEFFCPIGTRLPEPCTAGRSPDWTKEEYTLCGENQTKGLLDDIY